MPYTIILHVAGEEAVVGELEQLPSPADTSVIVQKVRRRDGKPVHYLAPGVTTVLWPMNRLTFLEVVPERPELVETEPEPEPVEAAVRPTAEAPPAEPAPPGEVEPAAAQPSPAPARSGGLLARRRDAAGLTRSE